jgi:Protein of unknown function (DUF3168)
MPAGSRIPDVMAAATTALRNDATLTALLGGAAKVYSHVPEDTAPPYVVLSGGAEEVWADALHDNTGRVCDIEALAVTAYRGTLEVDAIMAQVLTTLLTTSTYSGVTGFTAVEFATNERPYTEQIEGRIWYSRRGRVRVVCE